MYKVVRRRLLDTGCSPFHLLDVRGHSRVLFDNVFMLEAQFRNDSIVNATNEWRIENAKSNNKKKEEEEEKKSSMKSA